MTMKTEWTVNFGVMCDLISKYLLESQNKILHSDDVLSQATDMICLLDWYYEANQYYGFYGDDPYNYGDKLSHPLGNCVFIKYHYFEHDRATVGFTNEAGIEGVIEVNTEYLKPIK